MRAILRWFVGTCVVLASLMPLPVSAKSPTSYFVVGYITGYAVSAGYLDDIEMSHLTHIIWQGVRVTSATDATLVSFTGDPITQLGDVATVAHADNVSALVSLIGAWSDTDLLAVVSSSTLRANLVTNIANMITTYNLDGVEIDWEAYPGTALYESLINALYAALNPSGKIVVSIGNWNAFDFSTSALAKLAFVNVMTYDMYDPTPYPYHSTYTDTVNVMTAWSNAGYTKAKLLMGIPDYGRDDALGATPLWVSYRSIVNTLAPTDNQDYANVTTFLGQPVHGGVLWWGSPALTEQKVEWAMANSYGGVFIYELGTDKFQTTSSMFRRIYTTLEASAPPTLSSINVTPSDLNNLAVGSTYQFTAMGKYSDNSTTDVSSNVTWVSSNISVATISATGLASGIAAGSTNISANMSGVNSSNVTLTVVNIAPLTLTSINVTPLSPADRNVGDTLQFAAIGTYNDNSTATITSSVTWLSSNISVATISSSGLATGVTVGSSNISASMNGTSSNMVTMGIVDPVPPSPTPPLAPGASPTYSAGTSVAKALYPILVLVTPLLIGLKRVSVAKNPVMALAILLVAMMLVVTFLDAIVGVLNQI